MAIFIRSMIKCIFFFSILIPIHLLFSEPIFSAMDPIEINKRNSEAPFHIKGNIISDELVKDLSEEKGDPYQLRKMTINIEQVYKSPSSEEKATLINVYYSYIPSWRALEYIGGKTMDVAVDDVVEIWLEKGDYGWEPVLSGYSVNHLFYVENRIEHIPEPTLEKVQRHVSNYFRDHSSWMVLICLFLFLILFIYLGLKKK